LRLKNLDMGGSRRLGHSYMWFSIRTIVGKKCKLKIKGTAIKWNCRLLAAMSKFHSCYVGAVWSTYNFSSPARNESV
jgi:hypothetical protein